MSFTLTSHLSKSKLIKSVYVFFFKDFTDIARFILIITAIISMAHVNAGKPLSNPLPNTHNIDVENTELQNANTQALLTKKKISTKKENITTYSFLTPYKASYDILDGTTFIGKATRELSRKNDFWSISMETKISKWFIKLHFNENSQFKISNNDLISLNYHAITERTLKKKREISHHFNWQDKKETGKRNKKTWLLPLDTYVFDHLNYQIALRHALLSNKKDIRIPVSYKGKHYDMHFTQAGSEIIESSLGKIQTFKLIQNTQNKNDKHVVLWLAPEFHYIPIQLTQIKNQKEQAILKIKQLNYFKYK